MNAVRKQRLILISLLIIGVGITVTLALFALRENINHYFSPTQIAEGEAPIGKKIRGGGLVVRNSVVRDKDSLLVRFVITDGMENINVVYTGILPDLFKEGQGIIAIGILNEKQEFVAEEVLAKHDETYMPPEVKKAIDSVHHKQQIKNQEYAP
ncbi:MAG: cytochrome c maturation protein CcmE [Candidatus Endonucleobacter sp. (ex Gigantidas childressi)]|nr:cytochrome c maturation protein CcmE [Candidatus Endonucleobacter sp. (ex Gigantidas childressi)]